jgi:hypothetical protein
VISAQQYSICRKAHVSRRGVNKIGELARRLSGVTTQLIDLTGGRLHKEERIVFQGLADGRVDDPGMRGTDRIDSPFSRDAIAVHGIPEGGAGAAVMLNRGLQTNAPPTISSQSPTSSFLSRRLSAYYE